MCWLVFGFCVCFVELYIVWCVGWYLVFVFVLLNSLWSVVTVNFNIMPDEGPRLRGDNVILGPVRFVNIIPQSSASAKKNQSSLSHLRNVNVRWDTSFCNVRILTVKS